MLYFRRSGNYKVSSDIISSYRNIAEWLPTLTYHISGRPLTITIPDCTFNNCEKLVEYDSRQDIVIECGVDKETYKKLSVSHARNCIDSLSPYNYTMQRISDLRLLFAKDVINVLYRSLDDKSMKGIETLLQELQKKYPYPHEITLDDLSNYLCIQDIVFPYAVLNAFLYVRRDRWTLLKKCRSSMNDSLIINVMRNQLQTYIDDKNSFYRKGTEKKYTFSYNNLVKMYTVLFTEPVNNVYVLMKKYEEVKR